MPDHPELEARIRELDPWFHNFEFDGVRTAPDHFLGDYPAVNWSRFQDAVPQDLHGMTVLDIGCNAGFYTLEMKRRGADRVVGVDSDPRYLRQARLAAELAGMDIEFAEMTVYEIARLAERFDLVIFMGVLYHLRHPLLALDLIHEHVSKDLLLFQAMQRGSPDVAPLEDDYAFEQTDVFLRDGFPSMYFIEKRYTGDPTNWWIPNRACVEAMLRSSGFVIEKHPEREVYLCRRGPKPVWHGEHVPAIG